MNRILAVIAAVFAPLFRSAGQPATSRATIEHDAAHWDAEIARLERKCAGLDNDHGRALSLANRIGKQAGEARDSLEVARAKAAQARLRSRTAKADQTLSDDR
jgi:hypothetical protein